MTYAVYSITHIDGSEEEATVEFFVADIERYNPIGQSSTFNPDEFFLDVMTHADTLHDAVRQLLNAKLGDEPVFKMSLARWIGITRWNAFSWGI